MASIKATHETMKLLTNRPLFFRKVPFKSLTDAMDATRRGEVWGVVHFGQNFTDELVVRQADGNHADNETILASRIAITLDWSSE